MLASVGAYRHAHGGKAMMIMKVLLISSFEADLVSIKTEIISRVFFSPFSRSSPVFHPDGGFRCE